MQFPETAENFTLAVHLKAMPHKQGWLIPDLIPRNGLVVLAAAPKTGKTILAAHLARQLATGGEFLGQKLECTPVYWASHEETVAERQPYFDGLTESDPLYLAFGDDLINLDNPECDHGVDRFGNYREITRPYVFDAIRMIGSGLLIVDCLHAACRHTNLAENNSARRIMARLRRWANNFNTAILVLHHVTKSATRGYHPERFADSAQILAAASTHFFMESQEQRDGARRITLHGSGREPAPPHRIDLLSRDPHHFERIQIPKTEERRTLTDRILELLEDGWELTAEEMAKRLDAKLQSVRNALNQLPEAEVERQIGPRKLTRYRRTEHHTHNFS